MKAQTRTCPTDKPATFRLADGTAGTVTHTRTGVVIRTTDGRTISVRTDSL